MPDAPNPVASAVVTPPPGPPDPQTQSPPVSAQVPQQPVQQMNTAAQGMGGPPATVTVPTPVAQHVSKMAAIGQAFHHIASGTNTQYVQGPNGPVPTQVPNKPGQLFRSILAGALAGMGSAGNQDNAGSGWAAIGAGARGAQQNAMQQQGIQAQQAQQQWENQLRTKQEARNDAEFQEKQKLYEAQLAQANMQTLQMHQLLQHQDFAFHKEAADADAARYSSYKDSGLKPVFDNLSETDMADLQKKNPNYTKYDWVNTGTKKTVDANGNPTYESTYSAYDPKDATNGITISPSTIDQWKQDGLFKYHPEYADVVKPGKSLSFDQFTSLNTQAQGLYTANKAKQLDALNIQKQQAEINRDNAEKVRYITDTNHIQQQMKDEALGKTQASQFNNALDELNKAGGNFDQIKPSSRVIIAESMNKMVPALTQEYKDILASNDPDSQQKAGDVLTQIQNLTSLGTRALSGIGGGGKVLHPEVQSSLMAIPGFNPKTAEAVANMDPAAIPGYVSSAPLSQDQKDAIYKALKITPPAGRAPFAGSNPNQPPTPPQLAGDIGKAAVAAVPTVIDASRNVINPLGRTF